MTKRVVISFLILCVASGALLLKIGLINRDYSSQADSQSTLRRIQVAQSRGNIYDCNMALLVNKKQQTVLFVNPTESAAEYLKGQMTDDEYETFLASSKSGKPFLLLCSSYSGSHSDVVELNTFVRFNEDDLALHITGYLDGDGNGAFGIEEAFNGVLRGFSGTLGVRYSASATGIALGGAGYEIADENYGSRGGIVLTIDSEIQSICERALERSKIEKGTVVVLEVGTGEVKASASVPTFDRLNLAQSVNDENSPFLNRALENYSVGSVFKPVVAAAALEKGISEETVFECTGSVNVGEIEFHCHKNTGHGKVNMSEAMAVSCNCYFILLGQRVGADSIVTLASQLGFGKEIELCSALVSSGGSLPSADEIDSLPALANLSFGQGSLLASPLQLAAVYCAFASGGNYCKPVLLKQAVDGDGNVYAEYKNDEPMRVLTKKTSEKICEMLAFTVKNGSGKLAQPLTGGAGGKTATAETGQYEQGEKIVHTWFAGFYPEENPKYVIVIFREDGEVSSTDCAPVFRDVADGILSRF